ncbi:MAG: hypothetical protein IPJ27_14690 [Candidatus Accumulibacter sp.]|uniref:Uncharacterized protein n=1 Tax=Candidatus Accumulibacter proximus TaxID=2954385 RepID=A0A935Q0L0_9PROT|nr:hypothetical protein [Candidatus Accumulibacter proximus]
MSRVILDAGEIRERLITEAEKHVVCKTAYIGGVYWHEPDETGCNWKVSTNDEINRNGCIQRLLPLIRMLREQYNIPEPD